MIDDHKHFSERAVAQYNKTVYNFLFYFFFFLLILYFCLYSDHNISVPGKYYYTRFRILLKCVSITIFISLTTLSHICLCCRKVDPTCRFDDPLYYYDAYVLSSYTNNKIIVFFNFIFIYFFL